MCHIIKISLLFFSFIMVMGCTHINVPEKNIVMLNEYGNLLDPTGNVGCQKPPSLCRGKHLTIIPYKKMPDKLKESYVDDVLSNVVDVTNKDDKKKTILVYVHGGLNTQKDSVERAEELMNVVDTELYSPLFVNWRSSLISSYLDHAFFIRQGEYNIAAGLPTAPVVIGVDAVRSVARAPLVWGTQIAGWFEQLPWENWSNGLEKRVEQLDAEYVKSLQPDGSHSGVIGIEIGKDRRTRSEKILTAFSWPPLLPVRFLVSAPLIDGLGTSSWDNMLRRTQYLFRKESEFKDGHPIDAKGELSMVMRKLDQKIRETGSSQEVIVFGHSMGTIVLNHLLRQFPDIKIKTIVYMAAACSIHDFETSVIPYLRNHPETQFYNVTLHHSADESERWDLFIPYFDPAIRGSLLTWIDDFFSTPLTPMDKTLGKSENFVRTEHLIPADVRGRVHLKEFSVGGDSVETEPQKHGDFKFCPFWKEDFYRPQGEMVLSVTRGTEAKLTPRLKCEF